MDDKVICDLKARCIDRIDYPSCCVDCENNEKRHFYKKSVE